MSSTGCRSDSPGNRNPGRGREQGKALLYCLLQFTLHHCGYRDSAASQLKWEGAPSTQEE